MTLRRILCGSNIGCSLQLFTLHQNTIHHLPIYVRYIPLSHLNNKLSSLRCLSSISKIKSSSNKKNNEYLSKMSANDLKTNNMKDVKRLFELAKPERKSLVIALFLIMITGTVSMVVPSVVGKLMDIAKEENEEGSKEWILYGLNKTQFYSALTALFVVGAISNTGRIFILKLVGEKLVARLRTRTMKASLQQDGTFLDNNRVGDLISRLSTDVSIVSKAITQNTSDGARAVIQGLVGFGMMGYISWQLTGVMMLLAPPLVHMTMIYGRKIRSLSRELQVKVGNLTKVAEEQLSATRTIQAHSGERQEINRYAGEVRSVFRVGLKEAAASSVFFGMTGFVGNVGVLAVLLIGTSMIHTCSITVGELSSFMIYAAYTGTSLFGLSSFYSELMKGAGAAGRVFELCCRVPLIHPTKGHGPVSLENKSIRFNNVKFTYPTRPNQIIFDNMNLTINPGEHVCIVGPSGGGKSTLSALLLRYYDVDSGSITVGDQNTKEFNLRKYRRLLGVVQQEPVLFNGTILDNITYVVPKRIASDKERLQLALSSANCDSFISSFPEGLQTMVGQRGTQLSGGQKQRIALARAFLLDPSVLILDEATSALDSKSEELVAKALQKRSKNNKITISIAHRLSTIQHSSRVIVLSKHGYVAETGTYQELVKNPKSQLRELLLKSDDIDSDNKTEAIISRVVNGGNFQL